MMTGHNTANGSGSGYVPTAFNPQVVSDIVAGRLTDVCAVEGCNCPTNGTSWLCPMHEHVEGQLAMQISFAEDLMKNAVSQKRSPAPQVLLHPVGDMPKAAQKVEPAPKKAKLTNDQVHQMNNDVIDLVICADGNVSVEEIMGAYPDFKVEKAKAMIELYGRVKEAYGNSGTLSEIVAKSFVNEVNINENLTRIFVIRYMDHIEFQDAKALVAQVYPQRPAQGASIEKILKKLHKVDGTIRPKIMEKALLAVYPANESSKPVQQAAKPVEKPGFIDHLVVKLAQGELFSECPKCGGEKIREDHVCIACIAKYGKQIVEELQAAVAKVTGVSKPGKVLDKEEYFRQTDLLIGLIAKNDGDKAKVVLEKDGFADKTWNLLERLLGVYQVVKAVSASKGDINIIVDAAMDHSDMPENTKEILVKKMAWAIIGPEPEIRREEPSKPILPMADGPYREIRERVIAMFKQDPECDLDKPAIMAKLGLDESAVTAVESAIEFVSRQRAKLSSAIEFVSRDEVASLIKGKVNFFRLASDLVVGPEAPVGPGNQKLSAKLIEKALFIVYADDRHIGDGGNRIVAEAGPEDFAEAVEKPVESEIACEPVDLTRVEDIAQEAIRVMNREHTHAHISGTFREVQEYKEEVVNGMIADETVLTELKLKPEMTGINDATIKAGIEKATQWYHRSCEKFSRLQEMVEHHVSLDTNVPVEKEVGKWAEAYWLSLAIDHVKGVGANAELELPQLEKLALEIESVDLGGLKFKKSQLIAACFTVLTKPKRAKVVKAEAAKPKKPGKTKVEIDAAKAKKSAKDKEARAARKTPNNGGGGKSSKKGGKK